MTAFVRLLASLFAALSITPAAASEPPTCDPIAWPVIDEAKTKLGQLLFYDPILSGSKTVSCATCHHPKHGTSDGVSLSLGDGGIGLGPKRKIDPDNLPCLLYTSPSPRD